MVIEVSKGGWVEGRVIGGERRNYGGSDGHSFLTPLNAVNNGQLCLLKTFSFHILL